jgi:hypothetical protein
MTDDIIDMEGGNIAIENCNHPAALKFWIQAKQ